MHYNNLVVKVWLKVEVGSHMHTTVSLLYTRKKIRENIFYQGKIRELSGNFIFGFLWPPWIIDQEYFNEAKGYSYFDENAIKQ